MDITLEVQRLCGPPIVSHAIYISGKLCHSPDCPGEKPLVDYQHGKQAASHAVALVAGAAMHAHLQEHAQKDSTSAACLAQQSRMQVGGQPPPLTVHQM